MPNDKVASGDSFDSSDRILEELMEQALQGDRFANEKLMENFRNYLLLIANHELDARVHSKVGPSDVVQDSLLAAQQNLHRFRGKTKAELLGWLRGILNNKLRLARRHYLDTKKRAAGQENSLDDSNHLAKQLRDPQQTPSTKASIEEETRILDLAISALPDEYQQVLRMRNWQHLSFNEIAEQMNKTPDTARKLRGRAFKHLQKELKTLVDNPDTSNS